MLKCGLENIQSWPHSSHSHSHQVHQIDHPLSSAPVPQIPDAQRTGGDNIIHTTRHILQPPPGHLQGEIFISRPHPSPSTAAPGRSPGGLHLHQAADGSYDLARLLVDPVVPSQVAGIVISHSDVQGLYIQLGDVLGQKLGHAQNLKLIPIAVLQGGIAACTTGDHRARPNLSDLPAVLFDQLPGIKSHPKQGRAAALLSWQQGGSKPAEEGEGALCRFLVAVGVHAAHEVDIIRLLPDQAPVLEPRQPVVPCAKGIAALEDTPAESILLRSHLSLNGKHPSRPLDDFRWGDACRAVLSAQAAGGAGVKAPEHITICLQAARGELLDDHHPSSGVGRLPTALQEGRTDGATGTAANAQIEGLLILSHVLHFVLSHPVHPA